ncbi:hypothetical protein FN846DRAFT_893818 [Sphaerosporella brunnea]|uniref:Uncharacterized protein n=1 Tax=Sphaerosporella brunnea TaxID=1250544 RepID=A0A5J5EL53_9PEZI|nr:hypothetical protein FN846DRAFT_893818 [Sphaerosporella brunnea]
MAPKQTKLSLKGIHQDAGVFMSPGHNLHIVLLEKARENGWHEIPGWWRVFLGEATERAVLLRTLANMATVDKTRLYKFVDGLLRFATQHPDAAWYRALPPASETKTPLDVNVKWILPPGAPGAASEFHHHHHHHHHFPPEHGCHSHRQLRRCRFFHSHRRRRRRQNEPNGRDPQRHTGQAVNVAQAVKPDVLRDIVKENCNLTGTATTVSYPMRQVNSIDVTLKAIETRIGNVEESVKPEVPADIIKKSSNTADPAVVMAWPRHSLESMERTAKAVEQLGFLGETTVHPVLYNDQRWDDLILPPNAPGVSATTNANDAAATTATNTGSETTQLWMTVNALATRMCSVEQSVKPEVLGDIIKKHANPTGSVMQTMYPKRKIDTMQASITTLEYATKKRLV